MSGFPGSAIAAIRWSSCTNVGSAQIPAASPVQITGITIKDNHVVYQVAQIGSGSFSAFNTRIAFNGPLAINAGAYGTITDGGFVQTLWDTGTPTPGDVWGIKAGQNSLTKGGVGQFVVDGIVDSGTKRMYGRWLGIRELLTKYVDSTTPLTPGNTGTFNVWSGVPGSETVTSEPWTVTGAVRFDPVDKTGFAWLQHDGGGWYAIESEHLALQIFGTLTGSLSPGGSVTCSVTVNHNGISPGSTVTVYDPLSTYTGTSGMQFEAHLNRSDGKYYFDWVGC
jgi:hypothetical protein